jgi:hypothetical protein
MVGRYPLATPLSPWSSLSLILLEGTKNKHWERDSTVAFNGARPTSNLLGIQRLPWILFHRQSRIMMMMATLVVLLAATM